MPELPEVELARGYLEAAVLCQPIEEVLVEDERILSRLTPAEIEQHLAKKSFRSVQRHGKRLFLELDGRLWLTIHLGMTGRLIYLQKGEDEPAHTRLLLRFQNGFCLAFDDLRIFGRRGSQQAPPLFWQRRRQGLMPCRLTGRDLQRSCAAGGELSSPFSSIRGSSPALETSMLMRPSFRRAYTPNPGG